MEVVTKHRLIDQYITLSRYLDDGRIRQHLKRVEQQLRGRDVSGLPPSLQAARTHHLDYLHDYWVQGIFPRNHNYSGQYKPCFIDRDGRVCAVAHLLIADGHPKLADDIASQANYAYLEAMDFPQLEAWVAQSGLNKTELAQIQPTYPCPEECVTAAQTVLNLQVTFLVRTLMIGTVIGVGTTGLNILSVLRRRWLKLMFGSAIGIILGALIVYVGVNFLMSPILYSFTGYIPCDGAGVGGVCNPGSNLELDQSLRRLSLKTLFIGVLFFLASCIGLVKGIRQEKFKLYLLFTTMVVAVVVGGPGLFFLTMFLGVKNIFYGFDLFRFGIFFLITTGCVVSIIWLLDRSNKRREST